MAKAMGYERVDHQSSASAMGYGRVDHQPAVSAMGYRDVEHHEIEYKPTALSVGGRNHAANHQYLRRGDS